MQAIARWWDSVELWLAGLNYLAQVPIVLSITLAIAFGVASALDRVVGAVVGVLGRDDDAVAQEELADLHVRTVSQEES